MSGSVGKVSIAPTHTLNVEYDHHKCVYRLVISRADGSFIALEDPHVYGKPSSYHAGTAFPPEEETKESPQTDLESVVGAGTDFLMKVTEEAVITGMLLMSDKIGHRQVRDQAVRDRYRDAAEDVTLEELKRFTEFEAGSESLMEVTSTALHREEDPDDESDDVAAYRAAHGIPAPLDWTATPKKILPCDRHAPHGKLTYEAGPGEIVYMQDPEFENYLDATQGK